MNHCSITNVSHKLKKWYLCSGIVCLIFFSGCDLLLTNWDNHLVSGRQMRIIEAVKPYDDIRWGVLTGIEKQLDSSLISFCSEYKKVEIRLDKEGCHKLGL